MTDATRYEGDEGSSFATAIVIKGAASEQAGAAAERANVEQRTPTWTRAKSTPAISSANDAC